MPDPSTPRINLYKSKSDGSELVNYSQDIGGNWDKVDLAVGYQAATSTTRPSTPYSGKSIFQTDTANSSYFHNGSSPASGGWVEIPNSSSTFGSNLKLASTAQLVIGADTNLFRGAANTLRTNDAFTVDGALTASSTLTVTGNTILSGDLTIQGKDRGRGIVSAVKITANVALGLATDTAVMTAPSFTYVNGRAYKVTIWGGVGGAVGYALLRIYKGTGVVGTIYSDNVRVPVTTTSPCLAASTQILTNSSGANVTTTLTLSASGSVASMTWNANATSSPGYMTVEDVGLAADWVGAAIS